MNRQIIILIIFVAIVGFLIWQKFLPAFNEVSFLRQEVAAWQEKLNNAQELSRKLAALKIKYEDLTNEAEKISQAVTEGEDLPGLLVQLEDLSSRNGLVLGDVTFNPVDDKKNKPAVAGSKVISVDINLSGGQSSLQSFLKAVEENLRIMDVTAISFGERETENYNSQNFKVSLDTYYR